MPDPILVAIAAALAGKAAVAAASGGASALRSMLDLVKRKFSTDPEAAKALDDAQAQPEDDGKIDALGAALDRAARDDPEFAQQLRSLWGQAQGDQAQVELIAHHDGVVNQVSGTVGGHVVQARDITGGVSLGKAARRDAAGGSAR
jgi:multidrug resistance efflux pump